MTEKTLTPKVTRLPQKGNGTVQQLKKPVIEIYDGIRTEPAIAKRALRFLNQVQIVIGKNFWKKVSLKISLIGFFF